MTRISGLIRKPVFWLLTVALGTGLLTFRDFGLTWDEPLFYAYGNALGYAYSPSNWFSGNFDLAASYGPSAEDHKTRGPGYLLLARLPARALQMLGLDEGSAWHLVNFATFLTGVCLVYFLARWLAGEAASALAAALFATQPLLWGHGFINPKDVPFLVFFSAAVFFGIRMADGLAMGTSSQWRPAASSVILAAFFIGIASSNRVLGPLAGLLVSAYWLARAPTWHGFRWIFAYWLVGIVVMVATWPYLWESLSHFTEVFGLMADNPTVLPVLFADSIYRANELPRRYLPFFMAATLTEPVWILFLAGLGTQVRHIKSDARRILQLCVLLAWLLMPLVYVILMRPPMYDGMRHFLFILPPGFVIGAAGIEAIWQRLARRSLRFVLAALVLAPGISGIALLHPYEYAYFNSITGGTGGAFRHFETDYWLTCYKESVERFNDLASQPTRLFVHREAAVAAPYAAPNVTVLDERGSRDAIQAGDYILASTRSNEDLHTFRDAPDVLTIGRTGAVFCVIKRVP